MIKWSLLTFMVSILAFTERICSAEVSLRDYASKPFMSLLLEGQILAGDAEKIPAYLQEAKSKGKTVARIDLRSPGGDVLEAIKISEILNRNIISASAPMRPYSFTDAQTGEVKTLYDRCNIAEEISDEENCVCNSSCAIIWLAAPLRTGGYIGIHRPRFDESYFSGLSVASAQDKYKQMSKYVSSFLVDHEVPPHIITTMMSTPSGQIYILKEDEIALVGAGKPYLLELLHAKCSAYQSEYEKIQMLKKKFEDLSIQFDALEFSADNEFVRAVADKMLAAQQEYYKYQSLSNYTVCVRQETLRTQAEAQGLHKQ